VTVNVKMGEEPVKNRAEGVVCTTLASTRQ